MRSNRYFSGRTQNCLLRPTVPGERGLACESDGTIPVKLTDMKRISRQPKLVSRRKAIAFDSIRAGNLDIYVVGGKEGWSDGLRQTRRKKLRRDGLGMVAGSTSLGQRRNETIWKLPQKGGKPIQVQSATPL